MAFHEKQIKTITSILQWFYLSGFIVVTISILFTTLLALVSNLLMKIPPMLIKAIPSIIISGGLYLGLKNRQPWIVPLILVLNSSGLLGLLFYQPKNLFFLIVKILGLSLSLFELYFFSRKEVRKYFRFKGLYLFGK